MELFNVSWFGAVPREVDPRLPTRVSALLVSYSKRARARRHPRRGDRIWDAVGGGLHWIHRDTGVRRHALRPGMTPSVHSSSRISAGELTVVSGSRLASLPPETMQRIPAASAARTPAGASSTTTQPAGRMPSRAAASR